MLGSNQRPWDKECTPTSGAARQTEIGASLDAEVRLVALGVSRPVWLPPSCPPNPAHDRSWVMISP